MEPRKSCVGWAPPTGACLGGRSPPYETPRVRRGELRASTEKAVKPRAHNLGNSRHGKHPRRGRSVGRGRISARALRPAEPAPVPPRRRIWPWLGRAALARGLCNRFGDGVAFRPLVARAGAGNLAALPLVQVLSLGYFLESAARVARTGRLRDGVIGVRRAAHVRLRGCGELAVARSRMARRVVRAFGRVDRSRGADRSPLVDGPLRRDGRYRCSISPFRVPAAAGSATSCGRSAIRSGWCAARERGAVCRDHATPSGLSSSACAYPIISG